MPPMADRPRKPLTWTPPPNKPWMKNRPGETNEQRVARLNQSCYACGWECDDDTVLNMHQEVCKGPASQDTPAKGS